LHKVGRVVGQRGRLPAHLVGIGLAARDVLEEEPVVDLVKWLLNDGGQRAIEPSISVESRLSEWLMNQPSPKEERWRSIEFCKRIDKS